jgi:hypothetical protein
MLRISVTKSEILIRIAPPPSTSESLGCIYSRVEDSTDDHDQTKAGRHYGVIEASDDDRCSSR